MKHKLEVAVQKFEKIIFKKYEEYDLINIF